MLIQEDGSQHLIHIATKVIDNLEDTQKSIIPRAVRGSKIFSYDNTITTKTAGTSVNDRGRYSFGFQFQVSNVQGATFVIKIHMKSFSFYQGV